ncbi:MAG: hypothetical protein U0176_15225 [Bacteroidia bacterium]
MVANCIPRCNRSTNLKLDESGQKAQDAQADYKEKSDEAYRDNMQKIDAETAKTKGDQLDTQTKERPRSRHTRESWNGEGGEQGDWAKIRQGQQDGAVQDEQGHR